MQISKLLLGTMSALILGASALIAEGTGGQSTENNPLIPLPKFIMVEKRPAGNSLTSPSAEKGNEEGKQIPGGFTLQTADHLANGRSSNFQDLLRGTPGVFLQSESETEVTKVSIRGSGILSDDEPVGVQFLLDGLTLNQADGEAILDDFDISTIKYAEVFRGADAFRYGSLTLGGAINLVSKTGYDADRFKVRLEVGSYGYWRGQATASGSDERADYIGSLSSRYREGYRLHSQEKLDRLTFNTGFRLNQRIENRLYLTLDQANRALPGGLTEEEMRENPRQAADDAVEQDFNKKYKLIRIADKVTFVTDQQLVEAGLFWFHRDLEDRGFFSPEFRQGITRLHSNNYGAVINAVTKSEWLGHLNTFTVGMHAALEIENTENFENLDGMSGATTARGGSTSLNLPVHLENLYDLTKKLSLLTGAQLIYSHRKFSDHFLTDDQGDQSGAKTFYGINPKIGAIYATSAANKIFLSLNRGWQPPSFDNMLQFAEGPNSSVVFTALRPQHSWTLELGTRGQRGPWEWEFSLYHSRVKDELLELNNANGIDLGAVNLPRSVHRGVEARVELQFLELFGITRPGPKPRNRVTLSQSYTLNDFRFRDDPVYGDNRIAGIPVQVYEAELLYEASKGFYFGANIMYVPFKYAVDQVNRLFAEPAPLLGFKVGFALRKGFSVFLELKNALNKTYAGSVDPIADAGTGESPRIFHPGEGRALFSGITWAW